MLADSLNKSIERELPMVETKEESKSEEKAKEEFKVDLSPLDPFMEGFKERLDFISEKTILLIIPMGLPCIGKSTIFKLLKKILTHLSIQYSYFESD